MKNPNINAPLYSIYSIRRNRKSHPERSYQPSDVPAVEDPSGNPICISLLPETHGVKSLQICPATRCPLLLHSSLPPITLSFSPRATCGQSLRCAEELLLGRAVSLPHCPLARSSPWAQEPSPAQQHSTRPWHHLLCAIGLPRGVLKASGLTAPEVIGVSPGVWCLKQTEVSSDCSSLNMGETDVRRVICAIDVQLSICCALTQPAAQHHTGVSSQSLQLHNCKAHGLR